MTMGLVLCSLDTDLDPTDASSVRYKPEGLDALCRSTKFSRKELQIMYRGFKQVRLSVLAFDLVGSCPAPVVAADDDG